MGVAVKICGIKSKDALLAAAGAGARYAGFVFCAPSRQTVTPQEACAIAAAAPPDLQKVGLFTDAGDDEIRRALEQVPLDIIQLHGHETPKRVAEVKALTQKQVMMAICVAAAADLDVISAYEPVADILLFDTRIDGKPSGGTGIAFDWKLLSGRKISKPWMLAGGLKADNIADAVRVTGARILDVSSGVEDEKGVKDAGKIKKFIETASSL